MLKSKLSLPNSDEALPGRQDKMSITKRHFVNGNNITPPFPETSSKALFGLGCFWGAEKKYWQVEGIIATAAGYSAGFTPNPTYQEVCSGKTGHNEVVLVIYNPKIVTYESLLKLFWESHNPTQGMQQGNDVGTQYRSGIYTFDHVQQRQAEQSRDRFQQKMDAAGYPVITTEITAAKEFYYAEDYHQQYLAKSPDGYCGLGGLGITYVTTESTE